MEPSSFIITLPPPTPNGGLHVGHLSGPFLAGDVFSRATKIQGKHCFVSCYSDIHQSYVRVTAERQDCDPEELYQYWSKDINETLKLYHVSVDDYFVPEAESDAFIKDIFLKLYSNKTLSKKAFPFFYSEENDYWYDEAGISGNCPKCLASCKCGICEACGGLNTAVTILNPKVTNSPSTTIKLAYLDVLVLELEKFRAQLIEFYAKNPKFRQRYKWLVEDALEQELPDFPVTVPGSWGISFDHEDFPGQVINAWPELMAQLLYSYQRALNKDKELGSYPVPVNFFGFDNSYFYAFVHAALLTQIDEGRWLPWATVINEFYNLDHAKFSTSNNHVIWAKDLAERCSVDAARFYAAFNSPGFEKANFNESDMQGVLNRTINSVWSSIAQQWNIVTSQMDIGANLNLPSFPLCQSIRSQIMKSYSLERFHLRQAAEDLLHLLYYIEKVLISRSADSLQTASNLMVCFAQSAYPLMPNSSLRLFCALTARPEISLEPVNTVKLIQLPLSLFSEENFVVENINEGVPAS
ncbi:class I tRNA ligase family protein [Hahella sp. CR1]|uniref:class I tRNA ligase family protein n=1 Tax=Hahella sp. CR1 TaxID=2992807 RepID=UPI00244224DC|nr:class I tRNA ligase family protein [Hahella sp. CR1]MDG9668713.1 class I tRNA ligase family protein [Hahella sp. CR1]